MFIFCYIYIIKICIKPLSECYLSLASEDEGAVPLQTTPFPDIVRITPAPRLYPGLTTPSKEEEIVGGEIDILSPIPVPPVTYPVPEGGPQLADGGSLLSCFFSAKKVKGNRDSREL